MRGRAEEGQRFWGTLIYADENRKGRRERVWAWPGRRSEMRLGCSVLRLAGGVGKGKCDEYGCGVVAALCRGAG